MMKDKCIEHTAVFKAQLALAALNGDRTVNELASRDGVQPTLIRSWKNQLLVGTEQVFAKEERTVGDKVAEKTELFKQIGRLKLEWLKKEVGPRA
jgi:transposase-like protein